MTHPAALQALSTGPDNRPFSPTRQYGNETQGFFSRLLGPKQNILKHELCDCPYRHPRESKGPAKAALCLAAQSSRFRGKDIFNWGGAEPRNAAKYLALLRIIRLRLPLPLAGASA